MVLDEETLERMLASSKNRREPARVPAKMTDATDEFEVYERPAPEEPAPAPQAPPAPAAAPAAPAAPAPAPSAADAGHEEYPPRSHAQPPAAQAPPQPASAPPQQAPPQAQPAPPQQAPPAQTHQAPPQPAPSAPTPQQPVAPPAPVAQQMPEHAAPTPAPVTPKPATPARPQVFTLNRPSGSSSAGNPATRGGEIPRIALLQSDYNADVTDLMAQWAVKHAQQAGAPIVIHAHVPGVFDTPLMAKILAKRSDVDAVVVVGCVVQGETGHDELITREAARLLADLAYHTEKPVGLGIAGPRMTMAQAEARIKMGRNAVESVLRQWAQMRQASA